MDKEINAKSYEVEGFTFGFAPSGSPFEGHLSVGAKNQSFTSALKLDKLGSRARWAKEAAELYPKAFNEASLKRALNEVMNRRVIEVDEAKSAEAEAAPVENPVNEEEARQLVEATGVLDRFVESMAQVHEVYGDRAQLKAVALCGISAQLGLLPDGRPLGTNCMLVAEAGRGKNYLADAVANGLPEPWVYRFESASAKSFFYQAGADPERFRHCWTYPGEAEATDQLVETLRPLLSGGKATHTTVNKDASGTHMPMEMTIEGPITLTVPTVRNKLDGQLQTRMLVVELDDFAGRVAAHSAKVSKTLLADYAEQNHGDTLRLWQAALTTLTGVRRVVVPKEAELFTFDSDEISHGARLWRNFLSLMLTNAWLEQNNREIRELANGERTVVATAADYKAAYQIFEQACKRSVINLSERHREILDAVYQLQQEDDSPFQSGYSLRKIAELCGCSHQAVKNHRSYLTKSVGILRDMEGGGLRLVADADPSWWEDGEVLAGFPRPEEVAEWWGDELPDDDPEGTGYRSDPHEGLQPLQEGSEASYPHTNGRNAVNPHGLQTGLHVNPVEEEGLQVKPLSTEEVYSENGIDKPDAEDSEEVSRVSTHSEGPETHSTPDDDVDEWFKDNADLYSPSPYRAPVDDDEDTVEL